MASASIRPPKPESMPARFNYPSLPGNPDSTQPKSALVMVMVNGIMTNDERRAHLTDLKQDHLIDQVCVQEILPPEK